MRLTPQSAFGTAQARCSAAALEMLDSAILAAMFTDRPSFWQSLPASTAALMPPSLISLSDTPPAPARALVAMSANEWMPSSMPIGTLVARASFFRPSMSS